MIRRHFTGLKQFWTPNRASYAGHGELMRTSDLRKAYEKYEPKLPDFAAAAMNAFALGLR